MVTKPHTLCIVRNGDLVLLGMKKRGFGKGLWNGFGGKVEKGEPVEQAARRECEEEAGIVVRDIEKRGDLFFTYSKKHVRHHVHVFFGGGFTGDLKETEEMRPQWFAVSDIPYGSMWPDDALWLPKLLDGKVFAGEFVLDENNAIVRHDLRES